MESVLQNIDIFEMLRYLLLIILSIIVLVTTKDIKKVKELFSIMSKEKVVEEQKLDLSQGQKFDKMKRIYRLNKVTNVLEPTDDYIDIQELVNSSLDTALDRVLERFMPQLTETDEIYQSVDIMTDDMHELANSINLANEYREKYNLDVNMSITDVYAFMQKKSEELKTKLNDVTKIKNEIKEGVKNETLQTEEKSE